MRHKGMGRDDRTRSDFYSRHDGRILAKPNMIANLDWPGTFVVRGVYKMIAMVLADGDISPANDSVSYLNASAANKGRANVAIEAPAHLHLASIEKLNVAPIPETASMKDEF